MLKRIKLKSSDITFYLKKYKIDILFGLFLIILSFQYYLFVSKLEVPAFDSSSYLLNARDWLYGEPLHLTGVAPLISWIGAGIWYFTGVDWKILKLISPIFAIASAIILYIVIRNLKGSLFAFSVLALTMLNAVFFVWTAHFYEEAIPLFFVVATLFFLRSNKPSYWIIGGIMIGLTFSAKYPIVLQSFAILFAMFLIKRNFKLLIRALITAISIIIIILFIVSLKVGVSNQIVISRGLGLEGSGVIYNFYATSYYIINSLNFWGWIFLFLPLCFIFRKTYTNVNNFVFIIWFFVGLTYWSSVDNAGFNDYRHIIQFSPAVYFLIILAIENIFKTNISIGEIGSSIKKGVRYLIHDSFK